MGWNIPCIAPPSHSKSASSLSPSVSSNQRLSDPIVSLLTNKMKNLSLMNRDKSSLKLVFREQKPEADKLTIMWILIHIAVIDISPERWVNYFYRIWDHKFVHLFGTVSCTLCPLEHPRKLVSINLQSYLLRHPLFHRHSNTVKEVKNISCDCTHPRNLEAILLSFVLLGFFFDKSMTSCAQIQITAIKHY